MYWHSNTLLAQTEATLPPLKKQLEIERDLLRALTGHFPDQDVGENFDLSTLELPENLPLSLPSQLVEQRPDVREYEALLHQASAEIGVATANMLPQFTISGGLGTFAGAGMNPGALAFSVLAGVTQPIFEGGTLLHRRRAAIAAYDQALAAVSLHGPGGVPERRGLAACAPIGRRFCQGTGSRGALRLGEFPRCTRAVSGGLHCVPVAAGCGICLSADIT